jgi:hypothetical protein
VGIDWSALVSSEECCRRAAARRKWNERRRAAVEQRRYEAQQAFLWSGGQRGWQTRLAARLGVHRSTISRDVAIVRAELGF